ncbi:MAG: tRNA lysidine(34) synthetase TilS [Chitinophagales bacterium]|nr:tRNA lysidine(34) synthetase TilS [Chitinophagales bacterium]
MQSNIENILLSSKIFNHKTPILIACSGGRDSMALLFAMIHCKFKNIEVAHCNFNLRGKESDEEEQFVKNYCGQHQIPFHSASFQTEDYAKSHHISIEMAARQLRYDFFEKIRKEKKLHLIAVAHHQDDQLETILLNLLQGTGIHGLKGMQEKNDKIIRPLLKTSRSVINQYIQDNKIPYHDDSSNETDDYKRNFIRNQISPLFKNINTNYLQEISDFSQRMVESEILYSQQIEKIKTKILKPWKEGHELHFHYLLYHPACNTLFHELLTPFGLSKKQIEELILTVQGNKKQNASGQQFFSKNYRFILDKKKFYILPNDTLLASLLSFDKLPRNIIFNEYKISVRQVPIQKLSIKKSERYAYFDAAKIDLPLLITYPQVGDYFYPFGMGKPVHPKKPGKKKLSKYFKDTTIPVAVRERTPILKSGNKIIWVVGHRMDDRFKITDTTQEAVVMCIKAK